MSYHWCELSHASHMNIHAWMYQTGDTPLMLAAEDGHLPVVEYLVEKGANMEAKTNVCHVMSLVWTTYTCECIRMESLHWYMLHGMVVYQWLNIWWRKELIWRQRIEYAMSCYWYEATRHARICTCVNTSEWMDSTAMGCKEWSFTISWISVGEGSWYQCSR